MARWEAPGHQNSPPESKYSQSGTAEVGTEAGSSRCDKATACHSKCFIGLIFQRLPLSPEAGMFLLVCF